jgi:hypothetical protein
MKRRPGLILCLALLVTGLAGCGSAESGRLAPGAVAVAYDPKSTIVPFETPSGSRNMPWVEVGTRVLVVDDTAEDGGGSDRFVRVKVQDGDNKDMLGKIWRKDLRPAPK